MATQPIFVWNVLLRMMMSKRNVEIINLNHSKLLEKKTLTSARMPLTHAWTHLTERDVRQTCV